MFVQATVQGFESKGFSREESENLLKKSVEVACEARDLFWKSCAKEVQCDGISNGGFSKKRRILVAASIGSYGAYLADGSEYRCIGLTIFSPLLSLFFTFSHDILFWFIQFCSGNYGDTITLAYLKDFHRRRLQVLSESGADFIAFETIPNKLEAQVSDMLAFILPIFFPLS